jgi:hypothetical protein|nr:MAG TPA: PerC transcriptional activator [Caudoviricetes sp.]DAO32336.1 MAG TPA: PerC transcriptional activator [Caudoviricetes sp.]DAT06960.1 MAG TPA: PerC transcriptional activator [Caudoviricetes sp.]
MQETSFKKLSIEAAELEKAGNYKEAAKLWLKACFAAVKECNVNWCNARHLFCVRMDIRPFTGE